VGNVGGVAVGWEEHLWTSDVTDGTDGVHESRRTRLRSRGPYRSAVPARIAELDVDLARGVAADSEDALTQLARFDAELPQSFPPLAMAGGSAADGELAPLAAVLLRTESASSSQIENVTAGAKALALAMIDERSGSNARLVAANVTAMQRAIELSDALSVETILAAHAALMSGQEHARPGRFRERQVWIGGSGSSPHGAEFVPPHAERVPEAVADLIAFCDRTDLPVLTQAAVAHAQFETIHPFADGNGRTGRTLVQAMLRRSGVTRRLTVPVSAGLLNETSRYFEALTRFRDGDPTPIVRCFAEASLAGVANGRALVAELRAVYERWLDDVRARRGSAAWSMLPVLVRQPAVTVKYVQDHARVSQPAAQRAVDHLVAAEILAPASQNRRNRIWVATEVLDALDDFAERAGRRG
jgi:Fic family protein